MHKESKQLLQQITKSELTINADGTVMYKGFSSPFRFQLELKKQLELVRRNLTYYAKDEQFYSDINAFTSSFAVDEKDGFRVGLLSYTTKVLDNRDQPENDHAAKALPFTEKHQAEIASIRAELYHEKAKQASLNTLELPKPIILKKSINKTLFSAYFRALADECFDSERNTQENVAKIIATIFCDNSGNDFSKSSLEKNLFSKTSDLKHEHFKAAHGIALRIAQKLKQLEENWDK